eukprot:GGOE01013904.1.p1 GENE.GGOE01013904.1~~GGOE01013904.1.p1  ORF type:complete len:396 (-),score=109.71 GGOE01013904.1:115-1302(-)
MGEPRLVNPSREALLLELGTLQSQLRAADEEAASHGAEVSVLHRSLVILHERERRLEDMITQLCDELGVPPVLAPRPKEYRTPAPDAIDNYIESMTTECRAEKELWEERYNELREELQELRELGVFMHSPQSACTSPNAQRHQAVQVDLEADKDDPASWKAKWRALADEYEALQQQRAAPATQPGDEEELQQMESLCGDLQRRREELGFEQAKVREKIQKNLDLKQKIASIVDRARDRDTRRRERMSALEAIAVEHHLLEDITCGLLSPTCRSSFPAGSSRRARAAGDPLPSPAFTDLPLSPVAANRTRHGFDKEQPALPRLGSRFTYKGHDVVVRYAGEAQFAEGLWLGLELLQGRGKHSGMVDGVQYFQCADQRGVFVSFPNCMAHVKYIGAN